MKRNKRKLKLLNFFNKRNNKNRKRSSGRKRRLFASAVLAGNLLFGFNSFDGSHNSGKNIRTGNGTSLEFEQEVYDSSSNDITVQTGNGKILTLKQKADDSSFNEEFYLLDPDDRLLILAGINDKPSPVQGPSNFPVSPPSGGRPSRPVSGVNPYRTPPKLVDQGLGAAANPAGAGGGGSHNELDDIRPIPDKQKLDQNNPEHPSFYIV